MQNRGPTEIRTRVVGFKVQSDSHYTIGPKLISMTLDMSLKCIIVQKLQKMQHGYHGGRTNLNWLWDVTYNRNKSRNRNTQNENENYSRQFIINNNVINGWIFNFRPNLSKTFISKIKKLVFHNFKFAHYEDR